MKHIGNGVLWAFIGYVIMAIGRYFMLRWFSSNTHDRQQEAAMTSILFFGPASAVVTFFIGLFRSRSK